MRPGRSRGYLYGCFRRCICSYHLFPRRAICTPIQMMKAEIKKATGEVVRLAGR
jgi:hypothetical protein